MAMFGFWKKKKTMSQVKDELPADEKKENRSCEGTVQGEISEAKAQEVRKKREETLRRQAIYNKIVAYASIKDLHEMRKLADLDADGACGLDVVLAYCAMLYQPEHHTYYAAGNGKENTEVIWLPKNYRELEEHCIGLCYGMMMACLSGQENYLTYPQWDKMEQHMDQLCLEECMQFFLFYNRLSLRYGQKYYFEKWKDGTALRLVERMQMLRRNMGQIFP